MMQIAMQIGLHRPTHAQDFSKFKIELREEELRDRVTTWAACNVVAQRQVRLFQTSVLANRLIVSRQVMGSLLLHSMIGHSHRLG